MPTEREPFSADARGAAAAGSAAADERRTQLLTAPKADEADAAPRIDVTKVDEHTTRIDVRDDAAFRPGSGA